MTTPLQLNRHNLNDLDQLNQFKISFCSFFSIRFKMQLILRKVSK